MSALVADTHAAIWYLLTSGDLSREALDRIDNASLSGDPVYISSISLVEVTYLVEKGRLPQLALDRLDAALADDFSGFILAPLSLAIAQTVRHIPRDIVSDMPDRIIAATALHLSLPLITRDRKIRAAGITTIW